MFPAQAFAASTEVGAAPSICNISGMAARGAGSGVEVEIKFVGADFAQLRDRLAEVGARLESPRRLERNVVFDDDQGSLMNSGRLLRLRDGAEMTVKLPVDDDRFKARQELTIEVAEGDPVPLLAQLGFRPRWRYEKYREGWDLDGMWVTLDDLPFVGPVVEVEGPRERIDVVARQLGLNDATRSTGSYRDLYEAFIGRTGMPDGDMTFAAAGGSPPA